MAMKSLRKKFKMPRLKRLRESELPKKQGDKPKRKQLQQRLKQLDLRLKQKASLRRMIDDD